MLEAEISLTCKDWQKHLIVTGLRAPCILGVNCLRRRNFKDPKGNRWVFGIAANKDNIKQLSVLFVLSENLAATKERAAGTDCYKNSAQTGSTTPTAFTAGTAAGGQAMSHAAVC